MIRTKIKCELCGREISRSNYAKHIRSHENGNFDKFNNMIHLDHNDLFCKYCGKEYKNKNSLAQHEIRCKENPDRRAYSNLRDYQKSGKSWNRGLTKETDERVAKNSLNVKKTLNKKIENGWVPKFSTKEFWTDERKLEQSERRKKFLMCNPDKHPNRLLANNRKNFSYLENIVADWLSEHGIEYVRQYQYPFKESSRFVDFYLPKLNMFIEVDGEFWHKDCKDVDKLKDDLALFDGIKTIRISSKDRIVDVLNENIDM